MHTAYQNVWFCGLAASGKTMALRLINESLDDVEFLNDSLEMVEFIRNDKEQKHHTKPTPDSFVLSDSEPVYYSVSKLIEKAQKTPAKKVIEISRGHDEKGVVDFSYQYLFSNLPANLKKNSVFVYIYAPYEDRKKRNKMRPVLGKDVTVFESFFCPDEAFDRFFVKDDFWEAVKANPVDVLFIPNVYLPEYLREKISKLFLNKHKEKRINLLKTLNAFSTSNIKEKNDVNKIKELVLLHNNIFERECPQAHVTASALVVNPTTKKILLHNHKKLNKWLQFGGHADGDVNLSHVAMKEAKEETGLTDLRFYKSDPKQEPAPIDIDLQTIPENKEVSEHNHLDFRFLIYTDATVVPTPEESESQELKFFSTQEIDKMGKKIDPALKRLIKKSMLLFDKN